MTLGGADWVRGGKDGCELEEAATETVSFWDDIEAAAAAKEPNLIEFTLAEGVD